MKELEIFVLAPQHSTFMTSFLELAAMLLHYIISFVSIFGTLISVGVAVLLYNVKVKRDKKNAAIILLMEIRNAEKSISVIRESGTVTETTFVMPASSWNKFQHYFVSDFDSDELDLLSHFYNLCIVIQKEVDRMKDQLPTSNQEKIKITQQKLLDLAEKYAGDEEKYLQARKAILYDRFFLENEWFKPKLPEDRVIQHLISINSVLTTTCGQKLKKLQQ